MNYLAVAGVALLIACVVLLVVLGTEIPLSGKSTPVLGTIFTLICIVVIRLTLIYNSILTYGLSKVRWCFSQYKYSALFVLFSAIFYVMVFFIISMSLIMCAVINNLIIKSKSMYHPPFALKKVNCTEQ